MFTLSHLIIGLIITALGVLSLKYNFQLVGITGNQDWIERRLGSGTTFFAYKLFSLIAIFGGILFLTGLSDPFFRWLLSPIATLFPAPSPE